MKKYLPVVVWMLVTACQSTADLHSLDDTPTPLATIRVIVHGDLAPLRPHDQLNETPHLRVALVWGAQYQPDVFCTNNISPQDPSSTAVAAAGCRDILGFVPQKVTDGVAIEIGKEAQIPLYNLPVANLMVGDILLGRAAYASLIVYDDRGGGPNGPNGVLELRQAQRPRNPDNVDNQGPPVDPSATTVGQTSTATDGNGNCAGGGQGPGPGKQGGCKYDVVYGASFISMSKPDTRIAFREGSFDVVSAFYPRQGCPVPPTGFSVLGAGGFTLGDLLASAMKGELPNETACTTGTLADTVIDIALQPTSTVRDIVCSQGGGGGTGGSNQPSRKPPVKAPDLTPPWVCENPAGKAKPDPKAAPLPPNQQLVIAYAAGDCKGLSYYSLRGCQGDANCATPDWDFTAKPPDWWPCPPIKAGK